MEREIQGARVWSKTLDEAEWEQMERGERRGRNRRRREGRDRGRRGGRGLQCNYTIGVGKMGKIAVGLFN
jgi:hypothetical protein